MKPEYSEFDQLDPIRLMVHGAVSILVGCLFLVAIRALGLLAMARQA